MERERERWRERENDGESESERWRERENDGERERENDGERERTMERERERWREGERGTKTGVTTNRAEGKGRRAAAQDGSRLGRGGEAWEWHERRGERQNGQEVIEAMVTSRRR